MRRRPGTFLVVSVLTAAVAVPSARRQESPQQPTFRGGVTFVNVDVYPRRGGRVVEGLRPADFQVFEDGKPQTVEAFEFIRIEPAGPGDYRRDPDSKQEGDELAADPHNRVFVIYLDLYHTSFTGAREVRWPLLDFLDRVIGPRDVFTVVTPEMPVHQLVFGRRTDTITSELVSAHYFDWGLQEQSQVVPRTPVEEQLYACADGPALIRIHREDAFMSSLEELMVRLSVLRDERKNLILISEGWTPRGPSPIQAAGGREPARIPPIGVTPGGRLGDVSIVSGYDGPSCSRQAARLASIDFEQRFRDLLVSAQRANVAFYPVDVGGLRTFAPTASMRGVPGRGGVPDLGAMRSAGQRQIDTLRILADNTDGRAIVDTNGLAAGFRRIADDLSAYYLLGYSSTNTAADGRYRRIEVKVTQPKVSVTARRGYLAPGPESRTMASAVAAAAAVPSPVAMELGRLSRLRADAELFGYAARSATAVDVLAELSSAVLASGRWREGGEARVVLTRPAASALTASAPLESGARSVRVRVLLPDGIAPARATVTLAGAGGSIDVPIDVPELATDALVGQAICFRGTAARREPLRPVADFQFRRGERVHVEWPILRALDRQTARLLDRRGQPLALAVPLTEQPGAESPAPAILAADLALAPLAEGDYLIELTAGAAGRTERRLTAFRVVR